MTTHSNILAWKNPRWSWWATVCGCPRVRHLADLAPKPPPPPPDFVFNHYMKEPLRNLLKSVCAHQQQLDSFRRQLPRGHRICLLGQWTGSLIFYWPLWDWTRIMMNCALASSTSQTSQMCLLECLDVKIIVIFPLQFVICRSSVPPSRF